MSEEQEERMALALEMMAAAMTSMAKTYELLYYKMYPPGRTPRDLQISHPLTEEEKQRADQGSTGEPTTEDWMKLDAEDFVEEMGPRERRFMEAESRRRQEGQKSADPAPAPEGGREKTGA